MNSILRLPALLALGAMLATTAGAAFESIKINPDNPQPLFPLPLQVDGITKGKAVIAISVSDEGKLTEWLVLGYTHELFAKSCLDVLKEWRFTPAKLDGTPVSAKTELTFDFTLEGAVISGNITNLYLYRNIASMNGSRLVYHPCSAIEIDRAPSRIAGAAPRYDVEAEKVGVRGRVEVRFYIDETGAVRMPVVGPETHPYLGHEAVDAVREWRFEPAMQNGKPVLVVASQVFDFSTAK